MESPRASHLQRAIALLDRIPFVDAHNDLPFVIHARAKGDVAAFRPDQLHEDHDTDLPRLKAGKVAAQFWAAFIPSRSEHPGRRVLEVMDVILQMNEQNPDILFPALAADDVDKAKQLGKIASFMSVEGGVGLENSLSPLRVWYQAGMRLMTLCHNNTLDWVDSATDAPRHGGLSNFGVEVVLELNRLGVIVDLAHTAPSVMHRVLDISRAPPVISHGNAFALCTASRNVPDDVLARLKGKRAVVMATFVPAFLSQDNLNWHNSRAQSAANATAAARPNKAPAATITHVCEHLEYFVQKAGLDQVGIGSDYFGGAAVEGLEHVGRFPYLFAALMERGWSDESLAAIASENFLRVFREVERTAKVLQQTETPRVGRIEDYDKALDTAVPVPG